MLIAYYDKLLVLMSLLVAMLASYTALSMAARLDTARGRAVRWWLAGGALAMGTGIWAMHFIGMLAFRLPIMLGYDLTISAASWLIAVLVSGFALWRVSRGELPAARLASGALLMGAGIAAMHYTGMAAMRMAPGIDYDPLLFAASVAIAVSASAVALWIAFRLRKNTPYVAFMRMGAAAVMGVAIAGMHYTGMAAARFAPGSICLASGEGITSGWLAVIVVIVTLAILTIALLTSVLDARLESRTAVLARSLADANEELTQRALHDSLTGLPNRTLLEDRLNQAIATAARDKSRFALIFMDLDGFKAVNDTLGHHIGDMLLVEIAARLRNSVRAQDTVARLGGDEFVILAALPDPDDVAMYADKLVDWVSQSVVIDGHALQVSASMGIAIYPDNGDTRHDLVINADAAMYHTKRTGRNGYHFFEASMNANVRNQLQWLQELRTALTQRQFVLHYQPKFGSADGRLLGAEALVRWQHPVRGMVYPDDFIPLAEKSGLIVALGGWVIHEACRQARVWYDLGHRDWKMAVNLSALQFAHEGLIEVVQGALRAYALPARCLTLEVTESTAMQDVEMSMNTLHRIAALGVEISIDDFGTGYSSLLYLKRLPANELKIDRAFMRELGEGGEDAAIVEAIIGLGKTLGLRVVAEGVETDAQKSFLNAAGVDALQGYLLGRPMSAEQFMLAANAGALQLEAGMPLEVFPGQLATAANPSAVGASKR